jgi:hypothetical protein
MVDQAEIKLGFVTELQRLERGEIGVVGASFWHRHVEELDRTRDPRGDRVRDLDHDTGILRLHHVLVGRAAVTQVVAKLDRGRHGIADLREHVDGFDPDVDRARLVVALPRQHFLAHVPLQRDAVVRERLRDLRDLAGEMLRQCRQELGPVRRHHVVVGRRERP